MEPSSGESTKPHKLPWYQFISQSDEPQTYRAARCSSIWRGFKDRTTAHGVPHIDKANGACKVTFWSLVTLTCLGMLLWQISFVSMTFWNWKIDVVVKLSHKRELKFPSVTICNTNPIKLSTLQQNTDLGTLLLPTSRRRKRGLHPDSHERQRREITMTSFDTEGKAIEILAAMNETEQFAHGYSVEEMFLDCRYAGSNCDIQKFTSFFDTSQGSCFTFNSGWNPDVRMETSKRAGRRHGLQVVINIHQDEYVDPLAQGAGVRVVVHSQERMPFPSDEGILATPGQMTSVGVRQVYVSRLGEPYGNCSNTEQSQIERNVYEERYPVNYSANACYKTCYQKYVISRCGCADPQYLTEGTAFGDISPDICKVDNTQQADCKEEVALEYQNNALSCDCPVTCCETSYNFEVSSVEWPSDVNENNVMSRYSSQIPEILSANDTSATLRKNMLKLEIYFQEFSFETIEQRPSYLPANYASDLGGILGLWIGFSVLTIFEFFELFTDMFVFACYKCCRCCNRRTSTNQTPSFSMATRLTVSRQSSHKPEGSVPARRIRKSIPDTPPPPYTSTENLRSGSTGSSASTGSSNRTTRIHSLTGCEITLRDDKQSTLKFV